MADVWDLSTDPIPNFYSEPASVAAENPIRINELPKNSAELGPSIDAGGRRRVSTMWRGAMWNHRIAAVR